ncbi:MAG: diaminopimelate decarboxylase [Candidatus Electrothrix sp. MAN1_4]|nr:diaminopimelate decarboxylase [Candidatus Electrothrix sp. MAN1_4]
MWEVITTDRFDNWFDNLRDDDRANVIAGMLLLEAKGPSLSRPYADTIEGSKFANMKELRVQSKGNPLRAFFAFDPKRKAVLLCAGNKAENQKRFYKTMLPIADREYRMHLDSLEVE